MGQKNKYRSLYFSSAEYLTEAYVRKAIELIVSLVNLDSWPSKADAVFGTITQLYMVEHRPTLQHSTQKTNTYILAKNVEPRWSEVHIRDVTSLTIASWLRELALVPTSKATIQSVLRQCIELAALHNYVPRAERNRRCSHESGSGYSTSSSQISVGCGEASHCRSNVAARRECRIGDTCSWAPDFGWP
jgi:hypothetical protein